MYERRALQTSIGTAEIAAAIRGAAPADDPSVLFHASTDSTNTWARREIGLRPVPFVCITDHQTEGRGRHGRMWQDEPSASILMSVVVDAPPIESRSLAPLISGEAAARAIEHSCPETPVSLKWPNDLLIRDRKLGGLLVEAVSGDEGTVLIIGIGINANQLEFEDGMRVEPTSLRLSSGKEVDRTDLTARIASQVVAAFQDPASWPARMEAYLKRMHNFGGTVRLNTGSSMVSGVIRGIAHDGALVLETEQGLESFHAGDVSSL